MGGKGERERWEGRVGGREGRKRRGGHIPMTTRLSERGKLVLESVVEAVAKYKEIRQVIT